MGQYHHTNEIHNLIAPKEIVPIILNLIEIKSVVDVGCGLGTFLNAFQAYGIKKILGLDGSWCNRDLLSQNISLTDFIEIDLEDRIKIDDHFDLAINLEVAEHLSSNRAQSLVEDLTKLSNIILFSAAVPGQGGDHHYNEKWIAYWEEKFFELGYFKYDVLKPFIWNNPNIFWWYKQNMVLFIKKGFENEKIRNLKRNDLLNVIHPELYAAFSDYHQKYSIKRYIKLLIKATLFKVGLSN